MLLTVFIFFFFQGCDLINNKNNINDKHKYKWCYCYDNKNFQLWKMSLLLLYFFLPRMPWKLIGRQRDYRWRRLDGECHCHEKRCSVLILWWDWRVFVFVFVLCFLLWYLLTSCQWDLDHTISAWSRYRMPGSVYKLYTLNIACGLRNYFFFFFFFDISINLLSLIFFFKNK